MKESVIARSIYVRAAMRAAHYESLDAETTVFGVIPGLPGVYGIGADREECEQDLQEVLEEWIQLGLAMGHEIPPIGSSAQP